MILSTDVKTARSGEGEGGEVAKDTTYDVYMV
jgi:hypothetical protein